ncbi:unnamed protein product [Fraxinus pennsylvanica]|uniref:BHLH domain-containing protein n=1 Tax=Fraxinus pennsylvanica TaxID=56036 RepID=A0AAD1ZED2_9LAMI|nr:unnamed protein product [Fraxinus pennsylvanica]
MKEYCLSKRQALSSKGWFLAWLMEIASIGSLEELGMDETGFLHHWPVNSLDDLSTLSISAAFGEGMVKPKEETWPSSSTVNFPNDSVVSQAPCGTENHEVKACPGNKRISTNDRLSHGQDHIIAERKRRETISLRFIALSALVPGLKKMDKASILGDAIKYMKELQDRVRTLEEQSMKKKSMESVVFVKKYEIYTNNEKSPSNENFIDEPLPEIEARFSEKDVLIRIHCEKRKGIFEKTVTEIEKLHLSVVNSSAMTFGDSVLDITIIAKMEEVYNMSGKDFVKNLRSALKIFI